MTAALDLFYLLVENVFGGVLLAGLGLIAMIILIAAVTRMSITLTILLVSLFAMTYSIGYIGGLAAMLFGVIAIYYFFSGLIKFVLSWNT